MFRINFFHSCQTPSIAKNGLDFFDQKLHRISRRIFSPHLDKFSRTIKKHEYFFLVRLRQFDQELIRSPVKSSRSSVFGKNNIKKS